MVPQPLNRPRLEHLQGHLSHFDQQRPGCEPAFRTVSGGQSIDFDTITLITVTLRVSPLASGGEVGALDGLELLLPSSLAPPFLTLKLLLRRVGRMRTILVGAVDSLRRGEQRF